MAQQGHKSVTCVNCYAEPHDTLLGAAPFGRWKRTDAAHPPEQRSRKQAKRNEKLVELVISGIGLLLLVVFFDGIIGLISDIMTTGINNMQDDK